MTNNFDFNLKCINGTTLMHSEEGGLDSDGRGKVGADMHKHTHTVCDITFSSCENNFLLSQKFQSAEYHKAPLIMHEFIRQLPHKRTVKQLCLDLQKFLAFFFFY